MGVGLVVYDLIYLVIASSFYGGALLTTARVHQWLSLAIPWWLAVFPSMWVGLVVLIAEVSLASALCPRLVPGRYTMMKGRVFFGWIFRSLFRRVLLLPGLRWVIFSSNILRYLALRGMGAKIAFTSNLSGDVDILDPSLFVMDSRATMGARCGASGHFVEGGKLILGVVHIKERALLAAQVGIAPGVTVGARTVLKANVIVSMGVKIGDDVDVGMGAQIDAYAKLEDHARVPPRTHIASRVVVAAHRDDKVDRKLDSKASSTTSSAAPEV